MANTWEVACVELLRVLINDLEEEPTYPDARLKRVLVSAAFQVIQEATFNQIFTVDLAEQTISPDPTASDTSDDNFINLFCLRAACIVDMGKAIKASNKAVAGRDMNAIQFDLKGVSDAALELLKIGWCATYKEVMNDYVFGNNNVGKAVMGPFRTFAVNYYAKSPYWASY